MIKGNILPIGALIQKLNLPNIPVVRKNSTKLEIEEKNEIIKLRINSIQRYKVGVFDDHTGGKFQRTVYCYDGVYYS